MSNGETIQKAVVRAVSRERYRQCVKWGGEEHDKSHTPRDWCSFIVRELGEAQKAADSSDHQGYADAMVAVAALAQAALETDPSGLYNEVEAAGRG